MLSWRDDGTRFSALVAAIAIYSGLGIEGLGRSVFMGSGQAEPDGGIPVLIPTLLMILAGAAFAPDRWRGTARLAGIATGVLVVVLTVWAVLAGNPPWFIGHPLGAIGQVLLAVYLANLILLSLGFGLAKVLRKWRPV